MAYRDASAACPRCRLALRRRHRRDIWQCLRCGGMHLGVAELERWLQLAAPELAAGVIATARAPRQLLDAHPAQEEAMRAAGRAAERAAERTAEALACPICQRPLRGVWLEGVMADRCDASGELWFDAPRLGELIIAVDDKQNAQRSWVSRLLKHFFVS